MSDWIEITPDTMPDLDEPVFLRQGDFVWIGGRAESEPGCEWLWCRSYGAPWWNPIKGTWEPEDLYSDDPHQPTHFCRLPNPNHIPDAGRKVTE